MRLLTAAFVIFLFAAPAAGQRGGAAAADKFAPAGDGFAVSFPGEPERMSDREVIKSFPLEVKTYAVRHEGMAFYVSWVGDVPAAAMRDAAVEEFFYARLEDGVLSAFDEAGKNTRHFGREKIARGGFTGRRYVFQFATETCVVHVFKGRRRFYAVGVFADTTLFKPERAVSFLESFALTPER
ncbi:MAG TPA: hypothetical protein VN228_19785 [Pyrinomonadaceae bacterium]|nr:hypothetical protein [Pyrinomonadaceae bacterium]